MKKRRWTAAAVAVMLLFTGCSFGTLKEQKTGEIEYEIVKKEEIPEKLKEEMQIRTDKILKISKKALCG